MIRFLIFFILLLTLSSTFSQEEDMFSSLRSEAEIDTSLLPDRMIFTQRLLWGEKGLMRKMRISTLTVEQRESELKIRRKMLKIHQVIGYATLVGMVAQGFIGSQLYNGNYKLYETHKLVGNLTSISYFTGAGLSLFSPPPLVNKKTKGLNSIKAHKYLASIHFSAMVTTNFLANKNKKIHRIAAYTAFGSFATAIIVFKF